MFSMANLLASKPCLNRNTSPTTTNTAISLSSSMAAIATPIPVNIAARSRLQFDANSDEVAVVNRMDGDYYGRAVELEFQTVSSKPFVLKETNEYQWLMNEVKLEQDVKEPPCNIINAFPQPPSFSAAKTTDKRRKRHGVVFDLPKAQFGVDCGKWWRRTVVSLCSRYPAFT
ncbi:hypothetical protein V5O48_004548 [Marasmius crinis-equi]|uniref:Uncharacterized protein n=1 Tax=Marasmius crinis-equi TaxID=585013 RepID=A0ABR3FPS9_9AGAR